METTMTNKAGAIAQKEDNLTALLVNSLQDNHTHTLFIDVDREMEIKRWSRGEVLTEATRLARLLQQLNIKPSQKCAIIMSNQARWPISALAILMAGCTIVPINNNLPSSTQLELLKQADVSAIMIEGRLLTGLLEKNKELVHEFKIIASNLPPEINKTGITPWSSTSSQTLIPHYPQENDIATIIFTAGTVSGLKGCMISHASYLFQALSLKPYLSSKHTKYLSILSPSNTVDFIGGFIMSIINQSITLYQRQPEPKYLISTMQKYQITHVAVAPKLLSNTAAIIHEKFNKMHLINRLITEIFIKLKLSPIKRKYSKKLRSIFVGGNYINPYTIRFLSHLGLPITHGYGLVEAGAVVTVKGKALPGISIEIIDVDKNGIGEILVKSPSMMSGYYKDEIKTTHIINEGWLHTGDAGSFDKQGRLQILGRIKTRIVCEDGSSIFPEEIEALFKQRHPKTELCVLSLSSINQTPLENDKLVLVSGKNLVGKELSNSMLIVNASLPDQKKIHGYICYPAPFPRTATQKIKRAELSQRIFQQKYPLITT